MNLTETLINIGIGLATGYTSGVVVTSSFNKKAKLETTLREISEEKQLMVRYLEALQFEVELLKNKLPNATQSDYEPLKRLLLEEPMTPSIIQKNITQTSYKHIEGARNLIELIRNHLREDDFPTINFPVLDSKFIRAKLDVLMIEHVKNSKK
ncbi:hypothetical protein IHQ11_13270 [Priestia megaterium]|uniref:hypothetical protein n=1 Tax=Priestia megaterium TaxID=1404 RepID=UPI001B39EFDB|nr:hypothetical protein [Priestia megaterium]MBQ4867469.1 hypothetical protein [Priestia megaterium]